MAIKETQADITTNSLTKPFIDVAPTQAKPLTASVKATQANRVVRTDFNHFGLAFSVSSGTALIKKDTYYHLAVAQCFVE